MPSAEQITETVHAYLDSVAKGDADRIATLYATDATVEDPVGGEVHVGRQAIRSFYTAVENASSQADVETLRVLADAVRQRLGVIEAELAKATTIYAATLDTYEPGSAQGIGLARCRGRGPCGLPCR